MRSRCWAMLGSDTAGPKVDLYGVDDRSPCGSVPSRHIAAPYSLHRVRRPPWFALPLVCCTGACRPRPAWCHLSRLVSPHGCASRLRCLMLTRPSRGRGISHGPGSDVLRRPRPPLSLIFRFFQSLEIKQHVSIRYTLHISIAVVYDL